MSDELKECPFCGSDSPKVSEHPENCFLRAFLYNAIVNRSAYNPLEINQMWKSRPLEDALQTKVDELTKENERMRVALDKLANAKIVYDPREDREDLRFPDNSICTCPDGVRRFAQEALKNE